MARMPKPMTEGDEPEMKSLTESVTYIPGLGDPNSVTWCGHTFRANIAKEITGHPGGSERERLNHQLMSARATTNISVSAKDARQGAILTGGPRRRKNTAPTWWVGCRTLQSSTLIS